MEGNNPMWMSCPPSKVAQTADLSLDQMIEELDQSVTPETAAAFGEIKGLYVAYKLTPSTVLLEAILAKCLAILLNIHRSNASPATPVKLSRTHPASMEWEWVQGFDYFLRINDISETSRPVYIRALKRVMKKYGITRVDDLKKEIDWLIDEYDGCDQGSHNVHIAALRQFKKYMEDECGFFISVVDHGEEEIVVRIYCRLDLAEAEFEDVIAVYDTTAERIRLYDKLATLVKEHEV